MKLEVKKKILAHKQCTPATGSQSLAQSSTLDEHIGQIIGDVAVWNDPRQWQCIFCPVPVAKKLGTDSTQTCAGTALVKRVDLASSGSSELHRLRRRSLGSQKWLISYSSSSANKLAEQIILNTKLAQCCVFLLTCPPLQHQTYVDANRFTSDCWNTKPGGSNKYSISQRWN